MQAPLFNLPGVIAIALVYAAPIAFVIWVFINIVRALNNSAKSSTAIAASQKHLQWLMEESLALQKETNRLLQQLVNDKSI